MSGEAITKGELVALLSDLKTDLGRTIASSSANVAMKVATQITKVEGQIEAVRGEIITLRGELVSFKGEQKAHNAISGEMLSDALRRLEELGEQFEAMTQVLTGLRSQSESTFKKVFGIDEIVNKSAKVVQETFDAVNPDAPQHPAAEPDSAPARAPR
jgi:uncharacterized protein YoxC